VLRFQPSLVPIATAAMTVLALAREAALGAYPGAASGAALAIVALGGVGFWWAGRLERDTRASEDAPAATS